MSKSSKQSQSTIKTSWRESESDSKLISPSKTSIIWILMCTWNRSFCELNLSIINSEDHRFTGGCYHLPHKSGDIQQAWECLLFSWMTLASLGKSKKTAVCRLVSTLVTITYSLILGIIMVISNMNPHCRQGEILKYSYLRQKSPLPCCHRLPGFGLTLIVCFQYCQFARSLILMNIGNLDNLGLKSDFYSGLSNRLSDCDSKIIHNNTK